MVSLYIDGVRINPSGVSNSTHSEHLRGNMLPLSHIASALVFVHCFGWNLSTVPFYEVLAVYSSLLPDVLDKALYWTKVCKATRSFGHTLCFVVLWTAAGWSLSGDGKVSAVIFLSAISHLLVDLFFGHVPLAFPFQTFQFPSMIHTKTTRKQLRIIEGCSGVYLLLGTNVLFAHLHFCRTLLAWVLQG